MVAFLESRSLTSWQPRSYHAVRLYVLDGGKNALVQHRQVHIRRNVLGHLNVEQQPTDSARPTLWKVGPMPSKRRMRCIAN